MGLQGEREGTRVRTVEFMNPALMEAHYSEVLQAKSSCSLARPSAPSLARLLTHWLAAAHFNFSILPLRLHSFSSCVSFTCRLVSPTAFKKTQKYYEKKTNPPSVPSPSPQLPLPSFSSSPSSSSASCRVSPLIPSTAVE